MHGGGEHYLALYLLLFQINKHWQRNNGFHSGKVGWALSQKKPGDLEGTVANLTAPGFSSPCVKH